MIWQRIRNTLSFKKYEQPYSLYLVSYVHRWGPDTEPLRQELKRWNAIPLFDTIWMLYFRMSDIDKKLDKTGWEEWEIEGIKCLQGHKALFSIFSRYIDKRHDGLVIARTSSHYIRWDGVGHNCHWT